MLSTKTSSLRMLTAAILILTLNAACSKHDKAAPIEAPTGLAYAPDTAYSLKGTADTSFTPTINWNDQKGTFAFTAEVPQGVTIDNATGKISWPATLPIGTYILPVQARGSISGADTINYMLSVSGPISTIAGGDHMGFSGDGGLAVNSILNMPFDVTTDAQNNIYIADTYNWRIRKIGTDGVISTFAGIGAAGFSGDGGPAKNAATNGPMSLNFNDKGELFFTDFGNNRIRKIAADGTISTFAGTDNDGSWDLYDGGPATKGQLYNLGGKVAFDGQGSVYIADYGHQYIRQVTPDGIIHSYAGNGTTGRYPIPASGPLPGAGIGGPCGAYFDQTKQTLFVASQISSMIYSIKAGTIYSFAGNPDGTGGEGDRGDGGAAIAAHFSRPTNIVADKQGNMYIADFYNNKIRRISPDGIVSTVAGNGKPGFSGDGGPAAAAMLKWPYGLAIDQNGDLLIADAYNGRIRKVILH